MAVYAFVWLWREQFFKFLWLSLKMFLRLLNFTKKSYIMKIMDYYAGWIVPV